MERAAETTAGVSLPVIFFNGEHEVDIGNVVVHPALGFKRFKTLVSQQIGIPPHQISTSLVRRKKSRSSPEIRRKVPIDESSDFAAISNERDCFVLAILKRSRRKRSQRREICGGSTISVDHDQEASASASAASTIFPVKSILKRHPPVGSFVDVPFVGNYPESPGLGLWDYENHLQNMQWEREMYLMSTATAYPPAVTGTFPEIAPPASSFARSDVCEECLEAEEDGRLPDFHRCIYDTVTVGFHSSVGLEPVSPASSLARQAICEECLEAEEDGREADFHQCVYDPVTVGFRSAVGPVQRPSKKHVEFGFRFVGSDLLWVEVERNPSPLRFPNFLF